jgi:tetratricopeptide (TPR) repeat protein
MSKTARRLILYFTAVVVAVGLGYFGFVRQVDADVGTLVNSAEFQAKAGLYDEALDSAERAILQAPEYRYAWLIKATCHREKGQWDESIAAFEKALELTEPFEEDRPALRLHYANALIGGGRYDDAVREAREVIGEHPEQHQAWLVVAWARQAQGRSEDAVAALVKLEAVRPEDVTPLVLQAEIAEDAARLDDALELLDRAESLPGESDRVLLTQARILAKSGEREPAIEKIIAAAGISLVRTRASLARESALKNLRDDPRVEALVTPTPDSSGSSDDEKN